MKVLHLTAHLGGGVGKALSGLVAQSNMSGTGVRHQIICLEKPEKSHFMNRILDNGSDVIVCPSQNRIESLIKDSDIIQLEWWNHPATIKCLCSLSLSPIRLLTWSHISGLHNPIIPQGLILASHRFLFTSRCSLENKEIMSLVPSLGNRVGVVSSSGGFSRWPEVKPQSDRNISVGYIGSLNFAKLHPRYVDYLAAVEMPGFSISIIGDVMNKDILNQQCLRLGKEGMIKFRGYSSDVASELNSINVLAYLLNPDHYGTTENALLEAMAMGIVPIVLDNPAECQIIEDHKTGLIIHSPSEFSNAIHWLSNNPKARKRMGRQAAASVRKRFSGERMETALNAHYRSVFSMKKREIDFSEIFGVDPAEYFLSCQRDRTLFSDDGSIESNKEDHLAYELFEKSKGTVFHFRDHFRDNLKLNLWAKNLKVNCPTVSSGRS